MNGQDIITKYQNMAPDDDLDPDYLLQLANDTMHEVEEELSPEGLKKTDTSQSTAVGQDYTTAINLPSDFYLPARHIYVGTDRYDQVPFDRSTEYQDSNGFFFIDNANGVYYLTGTFQSVQPITFPYYYSTADITLTTSPAWPTRFHSIIPLRMAQMYYAADAGDRARAWDDRWGVYYQSRLNRFTDYLAALKLSSIGNATPYADNMPLQGENKINDLP